MIFNSNVRSNVIHEQFMVGFGLFMEFVDNKKNLAYHHTCRLLV